MSIKADTHDLKHLVILPASTPELGPNWKQIHICPPSFAQFVTNSSSYRAGMTRTRLEDEAHAEELSSEIRHRTTINCPFSFIFAAALANRCMSIDLEAFGAFPRIDCYPIPRGQHRQAEHHS